MFQNLHCCVGSNKVIACTIDAKQLENLKFAYHRELKAFQTDPKMAFKGFLLLLLILLFTQAG